MLHLVYHVILLLKNPSLLIKLNNFPINETDKHFLTPIKGDQGLKGFNPNAYFTWLFCDHDPGK